MVHLLAIGTLLCGATTTMATPPIVEPACPLCGDESGTGDEIIVTATVSVPSSVSLDDPTITLSSRLSNGNIIGTLLPVSFPTAVNPSLRGEPSASFTVGGLAGEQVYIDINNRSLVSRLDDRGNPTPVEDPVHLDLNWTVEGASVTAHGPTSTFPAVFTIGEQTEPGMDAGVASMTVWIGGSVQGIPAQHARYEGTTKVKMYYLE